MAAGSGTRMRSSTPKMLHPVCGQPMVAWPILAAREAGAGRVAAIVSPGRDLSPALPEGVETVVQPQADGTGGAIRAALPLIEESETVLVLSGDVPLIGTDTIAGLLEAHAASSAAATMLTIELDDPGAYGRVLRTAAGDVERVVEAKAAGDASAEEKLVLDAGVAKLRQAIDALPEPFKQTLVLRELHEMNYRQIAEITAAPIGTVMSRLARARGLLIAALRGAPA